VPTGVFHVYTKFVFTEHPLVETGIRLVMRTHITFTLLYTVYHRPAPESLPALFSCSGDSYKNDDSSEDRVIPRGVYKKTSQRKQGK